MPTTTRAVRALLGALIALIAFAGFDRAHTQRLVVAACTPGVPIVGVGATVCVRHDGNIPMSREDPLWSVVGPTGNKTAAVCTRARGWVAIHEAHDYAWLIPDSTGRSAGVGNYTYTITFELPADPSSYDGVVLGGLFSADDAGAVKINGFELASCPPPRPNTVDSCVLHRVRYGTNEHGLMRAGVNTLEFATSNRGSYAGLYASFFVSASCRQEQDPKPK